MPINNSKIYKIDFKNVIYLRLLIYKLLQNNKNNVIIL